MSALRRRGLREKLETRIKELEKENETLRNQLLQGKPTEEKKEEQS